MGRRTVLTFLEKHSGESLSEEQIERALGISTPEIRDSVDALRKEGYPVESWPGYRLRLNGDSDRLTEQAIRRHLRSIKTVGQKLCCFDEIDSTNNYAKKIAQEHAPDGTVVIADCQTAGRGRMNRTFQSPKSRGIYLTIIMRPNCPPEKLLPVTALTGVAVGRAVERVCSLRPKLKWPNDPVINGKKLCGILTEMSLEGKSGCVQYMAVGIGLNVLQQPEDFSPEVRTMATSLLQELGYPVSRPALAAAEIEEMDQLYDALRTGAVSEYLEEFRRDCVTLGKRVQLLRRDGSRECVTALDVDDQMGLVVRRENGKTAVVRSGEVSVRGMYGYME